MWGLRGLCPGISILGVVAFFLLSACEPVPCKVLTPEQKLADMLWLYSQFDENYAPLEYKEKRLGFKYPELKDKYLKLALETKTNEEFFSMLTEEKKTLLANKR